LEKVVILGMETKRYRQIFESLIAGNRYIPYNKIELSFVDFRKQMQIPDSYKAGDIDKIVLLQIRKSKLIKDLKITKIKQGRGDKIVGIEIEFERLEPKQNKEANVVFNLCRVLRGSKRVYSLEELVNGFKSLSCMHRLSKKYVGEILEKHCGKIWYGCDAGGKRFYSLEEIRWFEVSFMMIESVAKFDGDAVEKFLVMNLSGVNGMSKKELCRRLRGFLNKRHRDYVFSGEILDGIIKEIGCVEEGFDRYVLRLNEF